MIGRLGVKLGHVRPVLGLKKSVFIGSGADNRAIMTTTTSREVGHDKENCEFYLNLEAGEGKGEQKAVLCYSWVEPGHHVDMYHTGVPPVFRGQGLAKLLAKAAFDFAVEEDLKMSLTCIYLQKYIKDNPLPEYKSRVVSQL